MVSAPNGPVTAMPWATAASIAGLMTSISSRPNKPPSPACGLRPPTAIFGADVPMRLSARSVAAMTRAIFSRATGSDENAVYLMLCFDDGVLVAAGRARHERRIAVELDARERDRRLVLRRCNDRIHLARERELDRRAGEGERGAAARGAPSAEIERGHVRLRAAEHVDAAAGPVGLGDARDHAQLGRDAAGGGMPFQHAGIADHDRLAGVAHGGIERSPEADLWSDARRIARGDGNSRLVAHAWTPVLYIGGTERLRERPVHSHGKSEAWITSGTPWPPTDLMARSTSLSPNLWVVTFS